MKASELKELLKNTDENSEVFFQIQDGCCGDTISLKIVDSEVFNYKDGESGDVFVTFKYLPGYKTCIQSGGTQNSHKKYMETFNIKEEE
jgi:hypothetical protein